MEEQLRKAFEDTTTRNVKTNISFSEETRRLVRELGNKVKHLENIILSREEQIKQIQIQLSILLQDKYKNGS